MRIRHAGSFLVLILAVACTASDTAGPSHLLPGDPAMGRLAFTESCASCHASGDGLDLAFFGFADTTIVRRAVAHVDTPTARDIVAHIRALELRPVGEVRIFQPGGMMLGGDVEFATRLFGADSWPAQLTTDQLRAIDPRDVAVAVAMPNWSEEDSNLDWMPGLPLPEGVLSFNGHAPAAALAGYRAAPTELNLVRAVAALRSADRAMDSQGAPCILDDPARVDYLVCFDVRRWTSSLVAQHMIRRGIMNPISSVLHDVWWDVGNVARRSTTRDAATIDNAELNWASWMYLGWSFEPSRHASVYTGNGLRRIGLPRHATFLALRSQVARTPNAVAVYMDARNAANFAPDSWLHDVTIFGLRQLRERQAAGERLPDAERVTEAIAAVQTLRTAAERRLPFAQRADVLALADEVLAALQAM